jgi:alpha-amylase
MSAHDLVRATEPGLADKLIFDAYPRGMFVDHLLPAEAGPEILDRDYRPLADFANARYAVVAAGERGSGAMARLAAELQGCGIQKELEVGIDELTVRYAVTAAQGGFTFACQLDFTLLTPEMVGGRRLLVDGDGEIAPRPGARGIARNVRSVRIVAESLDIDVLVTPSPEAELWRLPIETVSQSEKGFERAYQGTALFFVWRCRGSSLRASLAVEFPVGAITAPAARGGA